MSGGIKIIAKNKRAHFDYQLKKKFEAGLMLQGTEVKALRLGKATLNDAFGQIDRNNEAWLYNLLIPQYSHGNRANHQEQRKRKLLLHQKEIKEIAMAINAERLSLIPTVLYFKKSLVKVELYLGKPKKLHDKRQDDAKKTVQRKLQRGDYQ